MKKQIEIGTQIMKFKISKILWVAAVLTAGCTYPGSVAQQSTQTQSDPATLGTNSNPYVGTYYACAKMTNGASYNIQPPSNALSCTFQDASGFSGSYTSSLWVVRRSDLHSFYTNNNNSLTFPVTNATTYTFTVCVSSPLPPPTNGQPITLQATWSTNSISK